MSSESKPSKTKGFKFSSKIDLDAIILSAINDLCDPKTNKEASNFDAELEKLQVQVKIAESKYFTVKILNIWTRQKFAVITLKFEQDGITEE